METAIYIFMGIGLFFNLMSILGLFRFPDVYTRLHASTKCTTFGALFIVIGVVLLSIYSYDGAVSLTIIIHSIIAFLVIILTNPVSSHAIARGAHFSGIKPYGAEIDELEQNKEKVEE
jgi:multicomponent Na+:H+ antiporter subunit G